MRWLLRNDYVSASARPGHSARTRSLTLAVALTPRHEIQFSTPRRSLLRSSRLFNFVIHTTCRTQSSECADSYSKQGNFFLLRHPNACHIWHYFSVLAKYLLGCLRYEWPSLGKIVNMDTSVRAQIYTFSELVCLMILYALASLKYCYSNPSPFIVPLLWILPQKTEVSFFPSPNQMSYTEIGKMTWMFAKLQSGRAGKRINAT